MHGHGCSHAFYWVFCDALTRGSFLDVKPHNYSMLSENAPKTPDACSGIIYDRVETAGGPIPCVGVCVQVHPQNRAGPPSTMRRKHHAREHVCRPGHTDVLQSRSCTCRVVKCLLLSATQPAAWLLAW